MILFINDIKTIGDLQDKFNLCFQSLKIGFYDITEDREDLYFKKQQISSDQEIGEIRKEHNKGFLEIKSWYSTSKVEQEFREHYGLQVHIFLRTNNGWVQAATSDDLTLAFLNKTGEMAALS
jgi:hypothetical protein